MVDGLKSPTDAIGTAFPRTTAQTCVSHLIRNSLGYACWKDRKAVAAEQALQAFADGPWGTRYPPIVAA